ncbi:MAG: metallophosphoesterase [Candidatus Marinimicrobia bacterium]|nr:metallophosphoesterase [Candidatus Neomarinimicrobiota bacterium]
MEVRTTPKNCFIIRTFVSYLVCFLFVPLPIFASEITFLVTISEETATMDTIYIWGSAPELGNWDIDAVFLTKNTNGNWELLVDLTANETVYYKYTKGSSSTVERGPIGEPIDYRILEVPDNTLVVRDTIFRWPRVGPYLSWVNDPQTTMTISWSTETGGDGLVEFGPDDSYGFSGYDSSFGVLHSVELTGLEPSMEYHYRVLSSTGEIGTDHTFSTAKFSTEPFTFVAYGDTRTSDFLRGRVASRIIEINPDLVFNTGDLVENGENTDLWRKWFTTNQILLEDRPFFIALGNHEQNATVYFNYWHFPGNEQWYSINYGNAHFICLSTETNLYGAQRTWLETDLIAASDSAVWIFVFFHRPPYSSGNHGSDISVRQAWCSLFETYGVDIVFNGHDHNYERSLVNDVYYIVTGGGGAPLRAVGSSSWTIYSESTLHCNNITIEDSLLTLAAIKPDGTIFDSFSIDKGTVNVTEDVNRGLLSSFQLHQNFPNPFNPLTTIRYQLLQDSHVTLAVYDIPGRKIRILVDREMTAGDHRILWDAKNNTGKSVASGVYIYQLKVGDFRTVKKMVLLR